MSPIESHDQVYACSMSTLNKVVVPEESALEEAVGVVQLVYMSCSGTTGSPHPWIASRMQNGNGNQEVSTTSFRGLFVPFHDPWPILKLRPAQATSGIRLHVVDVSSETCTPFTTGEIDRFPFSRISLVTNGCARNLSGC